MKRNDFFFARVGRALALLRRDENSELGFTATSSLPTITRTDLANRLVLLKKS